MFGRRNRNRWPTGGIAAGLASVVLVAACAAAGSTPSDDGSVAAGSVAAGKVPPSDSTTIETVASPVRLVFLGDVMLGRHVAAVAELDPGSIFEHLRPTLVAADLALANLESPLTSRAHIGSGIALEADPSAAPLLASAGIDIVDLANNHATDAGPETVLDTLDATSAAGVRAVGAGADDIAAAAPLIVDVDGVRVGIVAFDLAGGTAAGAESPGVNGWDPVAAERAVRALRLEADVVIVGLHGGVEYLPQPDPVLQRVAGELAMWGADVVWGHGAHVAYPTTTTVGGRPAVIAHGLGNALFDQRLPGTSEGLVLEVLVDANGVVAQRTGRVAIDAGRTSFAGWGLPAGDAVALANEWWSPVRVIAEQPAPPCAEMDIDAIFRRLPAGATVLSSACGDVTGSGGNELVVAYRRPTSAETLQRAFPGRQWADSQGLSAHLAVMSSDGRMLWGAATLLDPVGRVTVCSHSVAVELTTLDDPAVTAVGAWRWREFGFATAPQLPGPALFSCADVDGDGTTEPYAHRT
ncbi:MAG: CapA family protein [Actinomycetota bacterium]|nr:CapA family protein [Actinomycetota bacterium]